jgi:hypothetical protein
MYSTHYISVLKERQKIVLNLKLLYHWVSRGKLLIIRVTLAEFMDLTHCLAFTKEDKVLKTGSVSVLRWYGADTSTQRGLLYTANFHNSASNNCD